MVLADTIDSLLPTTRYQRAVLLTILGLIEPLVAPQHHVFARVGCDGLDASLLLVAATGEKAGLGRGAARAPILLHMLLWVV